MNNLITIHGNAYITSVLRLLNKNELILTEKIKWTEVNILENPIAALPLKKD